MSHVKCHCCSTSSLPGWLYDRRNMGIFTGRQAAFCNDAHACSSMCNKGDRRSLCRYLCLLAVETVACAWSADGMLPCLTDPHPLLPWHTIFGLDWRVAAALLALGLLLPYLACLLAFQLYLAATAQTARKCLRRCAHPLHLDANMAPHHSWEASASSELGQDRMKYAPGGAVLLGLEMTLYTSIMHDCDLHQQAPDSLSHARQCACKTLQPGLRWKPVGVLFLEAGATLGAAVYRGAALVRQQDFEIEFHVLGQVTCLHMQSLAAGSASLK